MSVQQQQPPPPPSSSYDGYPANNINGQPQSGANGPLAPYSQPGTYPFPGGYPPPPLPPGLQPPTQPPQPGQSRISASFFIFFSYQTLFTHDILLLYFTNIFLSSMDATTTKCPELSTRLGISDADRPITHQTEKGNI